MTKKSREALSVDLNSSGTPPTEAERGEMSFDFEGLIRMLAQNLYSEKKVFIRELVQNSHDGIRRREKLEPDHRGRIHIDALPDEHTITFRDNGIGMNREELIGYLSKIGKSGTAEMGRGIEGADGTIGQFGIGFLSGFVVAKRIEVRTRRLGETEGWLWANNGNKEYEISRCEVGQAGTTVKLYLASAADRDLIRPETVQQVVRHYCDMLSAPIHLNGGVQPINTMQMPWEKEGLSPEERQLACHIYLETTILGDSVLEAIPIRLGGEVNAEGVLYISKLRVFGIQPKRTVRVFQSRMFLTEKSPDLLPEWAHFVNGIVNTTTLTPNAARDDFIRNDDWRKLREKLGEVVVEHLLRLKDSKENRKRLSAILKHHDLGIKALCHWHDDFFKKFADLLEWRVNRRALDSQEDIDDGDDLYFDTQTRFRYRSLPEILEDIPAPTAGGAKEVGCFTIAASATQFFEMANAANQLVIDASYPYEDKLLESYAKLEGKQPIKLIYVDRTDDPRVFRRLAVGEDPEVLQLAETMSTLIVVGEDRERIKVEARYFSPESLTAVLKAPPESDPVRQAKAIIQDASASAGSRALAEEVLRKNRGAGRRLTINAQNPFIRRLALFVKSADLRSMQDDTLSLLVGVYNLSILSNAEALTPRNREIFRASFEEHLAHRLSSLEQRDNLEIVRAELLKERNSGVGGTAAKASYLIFFLMTPFQDFDGLEDALRCVIEERWGCQLVLARDRTYEDRILENLRVHMSVADGFFAEVSDRNANVMLELGAAEWAYRERPVVLLKRDDDHAGTFSDLPADLKGKIYVTYPSDAENSSLADHLEDEIGKDARIQRLLKRDRERYVSGRDLRRRIGLDLAESVYKRLADRFPTLAEWKLADRAKVFDVVKDHKRSKQVLDVMKEE